MLDLGPILGRQLITSARRKRFYYSRAGVPIVLLLVIVANAVGWYLWNGGHFAPGEWTLFGQYLMGLIVTLLFFAVSFPAGIEACVAIAYEREKRTLDGLLTTRLTGAQVVLGHMAAGMVQSCTWLLGSLPIMAALPLLAGVSPLLALVGFAAVLSMALFLASLGIMLSISAGDTRRARGRLALWASAWFGMPVIMLVAGRFLKYLPNWGWWLLATLAASSPIGPTFARLGFLPWRSTDQQVALMIGLQLLFALLFLAYSVWSFPAAVREQDSRRAPSWYRRLKQSRWRLWPRPECGDDPILWREIYTSPLDGVARAVELFACIVLVCGLGWVVWYFGRSAFAEVLTYGYGSTAQTMERVLFNNILRTVFVAFVFVEFLVLAGYGSEAITMERNRETWTSLLTAPLEGAEILRAKRWGALWRTRWVIGLLLLFVAVGLAFGALHPMGAIAVVGVVAAGCWLAAAMGVYFSLVKPGKNDAASWTLSLVLVLSLLFLVPAFLHGRWGSYLIGSPSVPLLSYLTFFSYDEVRALSLGTTYDASITGRAMPLNGSILALTYVVGTAIQLGWGWWFVRAAERRFDEVAGRAIRPKREAAEPSPAATLPVIQPSPLLQ